MEDDGGAATAATTSFLAAEDGFVVALAEIVLLVAGSFTGEVFPFGSSLARGGLTAGFLSSSGSSKFNDRTVDDDRHRSLLEDSCSTGFAVTLAPTLAIVVVVVVDELLEAAIVALAGADAVAF